MLSIFIQIFTIFSVLLLKKIVLCVDSLSESIDLEIVTDSYMYDLSTDPYEDTDVSDETSYKTMLSKFEARRKYWAKLTLSENSKRYLLL